MGLNCASLAMETLTIQRSGVFFRGVLRTPLGSVILVAVENMPISPGTALNKPTYNQ